MAKDLGVRTLKRGDIVAQAFNLGRCAALKFACVHSITDKNKVRLIQLAGNITTMQYSNRLCLCIPPEDVKQQFQELLLRNP